MTDLSQRRIEYELFLRKFVLVAPPSEVIRQVTQSIEPVSVATGGIIFEKGDAPRHIYFIVAGAVELAGDDDLVFTFGRGDVVGVVDAGARRPHLWTARATSPSELLMLPFADWLDALEDHPPFSSRVRRTIATALHGDRLRVPETGGFRAPPVDDEPLLLADSVLTRLLALREVEGFSGASVQALTELSEKAHMIHASAGQLVFPPGAAADKLLVVVRGEVHAEHRIAPPLAARFGRGQLVLECCGFGEVLGEYAITALRDTSIVVIDQTDIDDVTEDHFELFTSILRAVTLERERLRIALTRPPASIAKLGQAR